MTVAEGLAVLGVPTVAVTLASYAIVAVAALLGLTTRAALRLGQCLRSGRGFPPHALGSLAGAFTVWCGIGGGWRFVEGGQVPLGLMLGALFLVGLAAQLHGVGPPGLRFAGAEQLGILLAGGACAVAAGGVRWF